MWFDVQTPEIKKGTSRINPGEVKAIEWLINTITSNENYSTFINHWKDDEKVGLTLKLKWRQTSGANDPRIERHTRDQILTREANGLALEWRKLEMAVDVLGLVSS